MISSLYYAFVLSFLVALYGTPIARAAALRFGVVDRPDGNLKSHTEPVPYLGGLSIYLAVLISLSLFFPFDKTIFAMLLAGTLVLLLGLIDDFGVLTPAAKFIGQMIAVVVLVKGDIVIRIEALPDYMDVLLTFLWIIGMTNAFNIIDIMDGLAGGIALIGSGFLFVVALINRNFVIAMFAVTMFGSLAGFLRYNFHPAKIYMGDTGSMFLGMMLGTLSILADYSDQNKLAFVSPVLFFGVAIFDTVYVMILRALKGRSMFLGSKDHFALRLKFRGWSIRKIVLFSYLLSGILGGLAIANMYLSARISILLYSFILLFFFIFGWRLARIRVVHGN